MRQSIALVSFLASAACAADVVSFLFPGGADSEAVATIESANPSTTQFRIACPTGTDAAECGWGPGIDYTVISRTHYEASITIEDVAMSFACEAASGGQAVCTVDQAGPNSLGAVVATLSGTDAAFITATVVQGASLLSGGTAASATSGPVSTRAPASSGGLMIASGSQPAPSGTFSAAASASGSAAAGSSTGAAARFGVRGELLVVLAGAAALVL
ncbi:hypothetical protein ACN47E_008661 [Coniothyrium glycines]